MNAPETPADAVAPAAGGEAGGALRASRREGASVRAAVRALLWPLRTEERTATAAAWERLPEALRHDEQLLGRSTPGCAATVGVHEACDLACTACYLPAEANAAAPLPLDDVVEQLRAIRAHLGPGGQVQFTSGEVTLLPDDQLIALLHAARELELAPMLMTHGEHLLAKPERLHRLVREGGLQRLAIHVDGTQRGRPGVRPGQPERELHPLRDRMAELVRGARAATGRRLMLAHTVTVTDGNLADVADVVRWAVGRADAVSLLSFQPAAQVGRTRAESPSSSSPAPRRAQAAGADPVWAGVREGLGVPVDPTSWSFGHTACNAVTLVLVIAADAERRVIEVRHPGSRVDAWLWRRLLVAFGGWTRNDDHALLRLLGRALRRPGLSLAASAVLLARLVGLLPTWLRLAGAALRGRTAWAAPLFLVVHRFMDAGELDTPLGVERLQGCSFRVPVDGRMVSMCELNATELRRSFARATRRASVAAVEPPPAVPQRSPSA